MAEITLKGNPIHTAGDLPAVGSKAPAVHLTGADLQEKSLADYPGVRVLNIFPSVDTGVCAMSVRAFNEKAGRLDGVTVLNISADLPFAAKRFCGAEGIEGAVTLSSFRTDFAEHWAVTITDGPLRGLLSRAVVVIGADDTIKHVEQVPEIAQEPDYDAALAAI